MRTAGSLPGVTVSMPARNAGAFIEAAMASVLTQTDVELELIIVDDASTDDTAEKVREVGDSRVRLLQNRAQRGIAHCHNLVLREARAPFVAHVDADDLIAPGALRVMVDALQANPNAGQAHCDYLAINAAGDLSRHSVRRQWQKLRKKRGRLDHRVALLKSAAFVNHLRTYRRDVLADLGGFDERLRVGVDYDMGLRILDGNEIVLVPEFLYFWRRHDDASTNGSWPWLRGRLLQYSIRRRLIREGKVRYLDRARFPWRQLVETQPQRYRRKLAGHARRIVGGLRNRLRWRVLKPLRAQAYTVATRALSRWPLHWRERTPKATDGLHVAYYTWTFPVLSQTFVDRELRALLRTGTEVTVIADRADPAVAVESVASELRAALAYMPAIDRSGRWTLLGRTLRQHPWRMINVVAYLLGRRHEPDKSFLRDRMALHQAVHLAALLESRGATRVHTPWADRRALIGMLAARLVGIPFTVQARAFDLHADRERFGVAARLRYAERVVTNTRYNERMIREIFAGEPGPPVEVIHNGLDLERFVPPIRDEERDVLRLLSVGRLTPQKGFEHLLDAAARLKAAGISFHGRIIGGTVPSFATYELQMRKRLYRWDLSDSIQFDGPRPLDEILQAYADADIFVLPAVICADGRRDITPNVVLEAMAMELPVVSTTITGIPELVADGETGILVPPGDAEALAEAIERLARDAELRRRLGRAGRRRVEERFDIQKNVQGYVSLFTGE